MEVCSTVCFSFLFGRQTRVCVIVFNYPVTQLGLPQSAFEGRPGVSRFPGSKQWFICDSSGFVTCARVFMHTAAHRGCRNIIRVCTESWGENRTRECSTSSGVRIRPDSDTDTTAEPSTSSTHSCWEPSESGMTCPRKSLRPRPSTHLCQGPPHCSNPFLLLLRCWRKVTK